MEDQQPPPTLSYIPLSTLDVRELPEGMVVTDHAGRAYLVSRSGLRRLKGIEISSALEASAAALEQVTVTHTAESPEPEEAEPAKEV